MTNNLYDSLEICLQALEKGADLESCLARFPALADELRPILEAAVQARAQAVQEVPADALRRGRARVLQHAAELRERQRATAVPFWRKLRQPGRALRTMATSLTALVFLFSGGTGLVFASSNSLPGDNLYPVKRSWEGVQLAVILDPAVKSQRETEFEQERVQEIHTLFSESRKTRVDFEGVVETQQPNVWQVAGLKIALDSEVTISANILPGARVRVVGETENGIIQAEQISLVQVPTASQTPTGTPQPQRTATLRPTQQPADNPTEARESDKTLEPGKTERPDLETPEPRQTDTRENQPTEKPNDGGGNGDGNGGGDGGGSGDGGGDGGRN